MTQTKEEEAMQPWRQRPELCSHKLRNAGSREKLEEARDRFSPRVSRGSAVLPTS